MRFKVNVLAAEDLISLHFLYPLIRSKHRLSEIGIDMYFQNEFCDELFDCDFALLISKNAGKIRPFENVIEKIDINKKKFGCRVIWCDLNAHSVKGVYSVIGVVDQFWKKQIDITRFCNAASSATGIRLTDIHSKIDISWNFGIGLIGLNPGVLAVSQKFLRVNENLIFKLERMRNLVCFPGKRLSDRKKTFCFRGTLKYSEGDMRNQFAEFITNLGIDYSPVGYGRYQRELKASQFAFSPSGLGEVCFRDFEIMNAGAVLVKEPMDHIDTWPNFFGTGSYLNIGSGGWAGLESTFLLDLDLTKAQKMVDDNLYKLDQLKSDFFWDVFVDRFWKILND